MTRKQCQIAACRKGRLILCATMHTSNLALAGSPKMSKDLEGKNPSDLVAVIVQFQLTPSQEAWGGLLQGQLELVKGGTFGCRVGH